jgi:hypothetical protein
VAIKVKTYIVDADLVIEGILNRSRTSLSAIIFWKEAQKTFVNIYLTDIGYKRLSSLLKPLVLIDEDVNEITKRVDLCFKPIEVSHEMIMDARKLNLEDFESAIEIVCARKYKANGIFTNYKKDFEFLDQYFPDSISCLEPKVLSEINEINNEKTNLKRILNKSLMYPENYRLDSECSTKISKYINIAKTCGGSDWGFYSKNYNTIEEYWEIFQLILDYYYKRSKDDIKYYFELVSLWNYLNRFSDLYSHSEIRLNWLRKIMILSSKYHEWGNYFKAATRKAWTLTMQGKLVEAKKEISKAENKKDTFTNDCSILFYFYHCYFTVYTHNKELRQAEKMLDSQFSVLNNLNIKKIDQKELTRMNINYRRNLARFKYDEAIILIAEDGINSSEWINKLEESIDILKSCLEPSINIDWQRGLSYLYSRIADAQIELSKYTDEPTKHSLLLDAENYIKTGKAIAITNNNRRRLSRYCFSLSALASQKGDKDQSEEQQKIGMEILTGIGETLIPICR